MSGGMALGQLLIRPNLDVALSPQTCCPAQKKSCTWMQVELKGLLRARVSIYGGGWGWLRAGWRGGRVEGGKMKLGREEGWGMGCVRTGVGRRLRSSRAEVADQDQQLRACTGVSAAVAAQGTGGGWQ